MVSATSCKLLKCHARVWNRTYSNFKFKLIYINLRAGLQHGTIIQACPVAGRASFKTRHQTTSTDSPPTINNKRHNTILAERLPDSQYPPWYIQYQQQSQQQDKRKQERAYVHTPLMFHGLTPPRPLFLSQCHIPRLPRFRRVHEVLAIQDRISVARHSKLVKTP